MKARLLSWVHADGWILSAKIALFVVLGFIRFVGKFRPSSGRYPLTGTMSPAIGHFNHKKMRFG